MEINWSYHILFREKMAQLDIIYYLINSKY